MIGTNMKRILLSLLVLMFAGKALAADIILTIPDASAARVVTLCEELRQQLRISTDSALWNNELCATEVFRIGMREVDKRTETKAATATVRNQVNDSLVSWDANYPRTPPSVCGDTVTDTEFGETCDDGNQTSGDGCSDVCQLEIAPVCGNGVPEAPEECDDGNTASGDGCSATCLIEIVEPFCGDGILDAELGE